MIMITIIYNNELDVSVNNFIIVFSAEALLLWKLFRNQIKENQLIWNRRLVIHTCTVARKLTATATFFSVYKKTGLQMWMWMFCFFFENCERRLTCTSNPEVLILSFNSELTQIVTDVIADPTLPRTDEHFCPKCRHKEAVFFQSQSSKADQMRLYYVCTAVNCGNRWTEWFKDQVHCNIRRAMEFLMCWRVAPLTVGNNGIRIKCLFTDFYWPLN